MYAVVMTAPGDPEVLQFQEVPDPKITTPTEVLVELKAASINPIDTKLRRRGTFFPEHMPAILGCDGAGIVRVVGSEVKKFQPGDAVFFCAGGLGKTGNYAQYTVVEERLLAPKPASLPFAQAAALPLVLLTAWEGLYDRGRLAADQRVLIHGGAGGVGHVAIQLAKLRRAQVCTTIGSEERAKFVRQLGADQPIFYKEQDFVQEVRAWTGGAGVNLALDTVGGETFYRTVEAVAYYGDLVTILQPVRAAHPAWEEARRRNLRIGYELMLTPQLVGLHDAQVHQTTILNEGAQLVATGTLQVHVSHTFPLSEAVAAHRLLEAGSIQGKIVLATE
ncbi:zinc-binding dehydrogenase [Anthocerotibacter panamensis]|uniref:zinc-binding dehydrogenase n=1 Tax=Anthocerotibacter panamensis TaxID=2857077 RepID=UPI001C408528|nr:zinc-binding dehydrogenase [Anthocerotibacter panamensis]